jgi:DNA-3-methyladenine glycosylase
VKKSNKLNKKFFQRDSHVVAKELLGKYLVRETKEGRKIGRIVETEVYWGFDDKASHASTGGMTERNKIMFAEGGYYYVYLIYGIYWNLNIITEDKDFPAAVLIRSLEPVEDFSLDLGELTQKQKFTMTAGPGRLCRWLDIDKRFNGLSVENEELYLIDVCAPSSVILSEGKNPDPSPVDQDIQIGTAKRVGVDYAGESAGHEWRYFIKGNKFVSKL